jgi:hypothetical protein
VKTPGGATLAGVVTCYESPVTEILLGISLRGCLEDHATSNVYDMGPAVAATTLTRKGRAVQALKFWGVFKSFGGSLTTTHYAINPELVLNLTKRVQSHSETSRRGSTPENIA